MGGSTPDRAGADDYATLEEVFASRAFGTTLLEVPARAVVPEALPPAKPYFVRNRFVASASVAAAALSIVAGLNLGSGPTGSPQFAAKAPGSATSPEGGTPSATTTPAPAGGPSGSPNATGSGTGTQAIGVPTSSTGGAPTAAVAAAAQQPAQVSPGGSAPTATLTVVGTGSSTPTGGGTTRDGAPCGDHDHHHDSNHGDDHHLDSGFVRFGWSAPGRR